MLKIKNTITNEYLGLLEIAPLTEIETMVQNITLEKFTEKHVEYVELKTKVGNLKILPQDFTAVLFAISKALHYKKTHSQGLSSDILAPTSIFQSSSGGDESE